MKNLSKDELVKIGGNVWKKNNMERIYLDMDASMKLLGVTVDDLTAMEKKSLKKAKTFFDMNSGEFRSDVGTVRVMFNRADIECSK